jgi:hypothetical protein
MVELASESIQCFILNKSVFASAVSVNFTKNPFPEDIYF